MLTVGIHDLFAFLRNSCAVCCGLRAFRARTSPAGKNRRNEDESGKHHKNSI